VLSEAEVFDRHSQALGEARRACQHLGSQLDPDKVAPRGRHYGELSRSLKALEGSCRQLSHMRADARWVKLGVVYARVLRAMQRKFVGQRWQWFRDLTAVFELGERRLAELRDTKTGKLGPILPERPSNWLIFPEQPRLFTPPRATVH
jgi:hypothetical protein